MFLKCVFIILAIHLTIVTSKHDKFYRKDYTYVFEYQAFYKLHVDNNTSWQDAFLTCEKERAKLFYPSEYDEWRIVKKLRGAMAESAHVADVLIGVHNQFNLGEFLTVDGNPPPIPMGDDLQHVEEGEACVTMDSNTGSYKKGGCTRRSPTLFVCKKLDTQPCPTTPCPTIDTDYKYSLQSNKCYKLNKNAKAWQEAIQTCYMEGGLLAVAEDRQSVNAIHGVLRLDQHTTYFIGLRDLFNNGNYYTVKGKNIGDLPLVDERSRNQNVPDPYNPDEYDLFEPVTERKVVSHVPRTSGCGVISDLNIKATSCYDTQPFICEMEANKHH